MSMSDSIPRASLEHGTSKDVHKSFQLRKEVI